MKKDNLGARCSCGRTEQTNVYFLSLQKRGEADKNGEDKDKTQDNKDVICNSTPAQTPTGTPGANSTPNATETNNTPNTPSSAGTKQRPSSRVLQPPGGASSGLW